MGLLALFRRTPPSANIAKERLRIIVAQERGARGGPDYLPLLRRELLEVIRKYVNVDPDAIQISLEREDGHEVLELSVALPEKKVTPPAAAKPADGKAPAGEKKKG
ncbi:MAG: cell division topological specificity factor MinE [Gammaproteobacteria bacterium]